MKSNNCGVKPAFIKFCNPITKQTAYFNTKSFTMHRLRFGYELISPCRKVKIRKHLDEGIFIYIGDEDDRSSININDLKIRTKKCKEHYTKIINAYLF